jgi:hypothetical protein
VYLAVSTSAREAMDASVGNREYDRKDGSETEKGESSVQRMPAL